MANNIYGVGLRNVGSYQVAGSPYLTASNLSNEEKQFLFPKVTKKIIVENTGSSDVFLYFLSTPDDMLILPTTKKLKARCVRNLSNILSLNEKDSLKLLEKSKWNIRIAIIIYKMDISFSKAKALYKKVSIIEILDG